MDHKTDQPGKTSAAKFAPESRQNKKNTIKPMIHHMTSADRHVQNSGIVTANHRSMMKSSHNEPPPSSRETRCLVGCEASTAHGGHKYFSDMVDVARFATQKHKIRLFMKNRIAILTVSFLLSSLGVSSADTMPIISQSPSSQNVLSGSNVVLAVQVTGDNLQCHWLFNGDVIPGATALVLTLTNVTTDSSGAYQAVVFNSAGLVKSACANVQIIAPLVPLADNFANRGVINTATGCGVSTSRGATREAGEPKPANVHAGKSVWITWVAPINGIATFATFGSAFDTVLGVYTGTSLTSLVEVASDDDSGGNHTSCVTFNAQAGVAYQIYVGSLDKDGGDIMLSWNVASMAYVLPMIITQPTNVTTIPGSPATLSLQFSSPTPVTVQWYHNGVAIPGANTQTVLPTGIITSIVSPNLTEADLGIYEVSLSTPAWNWFSKPVEIQFNSQGSPAACARNKLFDAAN